MLVIEKENISIKIKLVICLWSRIKNRGIKKEESAF